ncbi:hypothetical protein Fmac_009767 [Flemingia macrophylla]|uniref:NB-ARC domain-containing protein n=1 Tax=Flemingia macrophylla TaxID=520843 RepID=A0ABD1N181_9FABA
MGGIGKTTLATVLYDKLSREFEGHCLVANVKEKSEKCENLCEEIFSKLSKKRNHSFEASELHWLLQRKRVFIVLDDVATQEQLEEVIYQFYPLGPGSRVIVTTRYKQIFKLDAEIYPVKKLSHHHSLELCCLTAFEKKQPSIPLALKVMGASLRTKTKEVWESQLNKL